MMKLLFLFFGLFVAGSLQEPIDEEWEAYKVEYNKTYGCGGEEELRKKIFKETKLKIDKHNQEYDQGLTTFTLGINQFADILNSEFTANLG